MKSNFLLPNKYKLLGWILFTLGIVAGILFYAQILDGEMLRTKVFSVYNDGIFGKNNGFFKVIENGVLDEVVAILIIVGGLIVGFSKERVEDEFIYQLRTESLIWAIIFNYIVLLFTLLFVYNMTFFNVLIFNMFTPLIFFIIRFNFLKLKSNSDEE